MRKELADTAEHNVRFEPSPFRRQHAGEVALRIIAVALGIGDQE